MAGRSLKEYKERALHVPITQWGSEDKFDEPAATAPSLAYTPPDLKSLYAQYKQTGTVPYSYYGAGAPSREEELKAVQAAYPGAFSPAPAPAPTGAPAPNAAPTDPFARLKMSLQGRRY